RIGGMGEFVQSGAPGARRRRGASVISVFGELLITAGIIALLYVSWQMWIGDWIIGSQKQAEATELTQSWAQEFENAVPTPLPSETDDVVIPVLDQPDHGETFAVMQVPRFGKKWSF